MSADPRTAGDAPLARFSLRFVDPELERAYRLDFAERTRLGARVLGIFAVVILALAGIPEILQFPPRIVPIVAAVRYGVIVLPLAVAVSVTFSRAFHRYLDAALVSSIVLVCAGYAGITAHFPDDLGPLGILGARSRVAIADGKFAFVAMLGEVLMIAAAATGAMRFVPAMLTGSAVIVTTIAAAAVFRPAPIAVAYQAFLLIPGVVLCVLGCRHMERLRRRNFHDAQQIVAARLRSEELLLSILPRPIVERLRATPGALADAFEDVSVLFADIVSFTPLAGRVPPADLVALLNDIFSRFDRLTDARGLEKIKTIGDAYLVAGGLPRPNDAHLEAIAELALDMLDAAHAVARPDGLPFELRIGLHVGPAVAGVIGRRKLAYDIWGDTVNTASRMESHGAPGRIQVSEAVYQKLRDRFTFEERGEIEVKGLGRMRTWFLTGRRG